MSAPDWAQPDPGWSPLLGIPMPTQMVCHPDDEDRMRAALAADPVWAKVELIANPVVGRGVLLLVDQRATAVYGEPVPPSYEHAVTQQRFCCDTVRGSEHLRHCPFAYRPIEPVGPAPPAQRSDAYDYLGPIGPDHMATECGLRVNTPDDELEEIASKILDDPEPCPFDPATLGPALVTWRDDLRHLAELDGEDNR